MEESLKGMQNKNLKNDQTSKLRFDSKSEFNEKENEIKGIPLYASRFVSVVCERKRG